MLNGPVNCMGLKLRLQCECSLFFLFFLDFSSLPISSDMFGRDYHVAELWYMNTLLD